MAPLTTGSDNDCRNGSWMHSQNKISVTVLPFMHSVGSLLHYIPAEGIHNYQGKILGLDKKNSH
jgi:hypothetical protein